MIHVFILFYLLRNLTKQINESFKVQPSSTLCSNASKRVGIIVMHCHEKTVNIENAYKHLCTRSLTIQGLYLN